MRFGQRTESATAVVTSNVTSPPSSAGHTSQASAPEEDLDHPMMACDESTHAPSSATASQRMLPGVQHATVAYRPTATAPASAGPDALPSATHSATPSTTTPDNMDTSDCPSVGAATTANPYTASGNTNGSAGSPPAAGPSGQSATDAGLHRAQHPAPVAVCPPVMSRRGAHGSPSKASSIWLDPNGGDPKKVQRMLANRLHAQRSIQKKRASQQQAAAAGAVRGPHRATSPQAAALSGRGQQPATSSPQSAARKARRDRLLAVQRQANELLSHIRQKHCSAPDARGRCQGAVSGAGVPLQQHTSAPMPTSADARLAQQHGMGVLPVPMPHDAYDADPVSGAPVAGGLQRQQSLRGVLPSAFQYQGAQDATVASLAAHSAGAPGPSSHGNSRDMSPRAAAAMAAAAAAAATAAQLTSQHAAAEAAALLGGMHSQCGRAAMTLARVRGLCADLEAANIGLAKSIMELEQQEQEAVACTAASPGALNTCASLPPPLTAPLAAASPRSRGAGPVRRLYLQPVLPADTAAAGHWHPPATISDLQLAPVSTHLTPQPTSTAAAAAAVLEHRLSGNSQQQPSSLPAAHSYDPSVGHMQQPAHTHSASRSHSAGVVVACSPFLAPPAAPTMPQQPHANASELEASASAGHSADVCPTEGDVGLSLGTLWGEEGEEVGEEQDSMLRHLLGSFAPDMDDGPMLVAGPASAAAGATMAPRPSPDEAPIGGRFRSPQPMFASALPAAAGGGQGALPQGPPRRRASRNALAAAEGLLADEFWQQQEALHGGNRQMVQAPPPSQSPRHLPQQQQQQQQQGVPQQYASQQLLTQEHSHDESYTYQPERAASAPQGRMRFPDSAHGPQMQQHAHTIAYELASSGYGQASAEVFYSGRVVTSDPAFAAPRAPPQARRSPFFGSKDMPWQHQQHQQHQHHHHHQQQYQEQQHQQAGAYGGSEQPPLRDLLARISSQERFAAGAPASGGGELFRRQQGAADRGGLARSWSDADAMHSEYYQQQHQQHQQHQQQQRYLQHPRSDAFPIAPLVTTYSADADFSFHPSSAPSNAPRGYDWGPPVSPRNLPSRLSMPPARVGTASNNLQQQQKQEQKRPLDQPDQATSPHSVATQMHASSGDAVGGVNACQQQQGSRDSRSNSSNLGTQSRVVSTEMPDGVHAGAKGPLGCRADAMVQVGGGLALPRLRVPELLNPDMEVISPERAGTPMAAAEGGSTPSRKKRAAIKAGAIARIVTTTVCAAGEAGAGDGSKGRATTSGAAAAAGAPAGAASGSAPSSPLSRTGSGAPGSPTFNKRSSCGRLPGLDPRLDPNIDPKRAARIMANRISAARSYQRKLELKRQQQQAAGGTPVETGWERQEAAEEN